MFGELLGEFKGNMLVNYCPLMDRNDVVLRMHPAINVILVLSSAL